MYVPVSKPWIDEVEKEAALRVLEKGEISGFSGDCIPAFERKFADFCGASEAVAVSNGTTALHLALVTLNIVKDDEVIVSSFTNMATFFAVLYQGAKPVPVDSELGTWNIDVSKIEEKITSRTKAIMVVHIYGHSVDMDPVLELAKKYHLYVIEDAAEAHGATYKGKRVGSLGDIGCFSFYANKIITTGEGGMMTFADPKVAQRARMLKSLAFGIENKFMHQDVGYNYRMTNLQAAIGLAQMSKIDEILAKKRAMAAYYLEELKDVAGLMLPIEKPYATNVYWMFNVVLDGALRGKRSEVMRALKQKGVETREDFIPYNQQNEKINPGYANAADCPVANECGAQGFYIPSGTIISQEEQAHVVQSLKEVINELSRP